MSNHPTAVLVHPGAYHPAYEMALAAQEGGYLSRFITGAYYKRDHTLYKLLEQLPSRLRSSLAREFKRRYKDELDAELVQSLEWLEFWKLAVLRAPILASALKLVGVRRVVTWYTEQFDWYASQLLPRQRENMVVAFQGGALRILQRAKQHGATTVLDQACAFDADQFVAEEYARLGLQRPIGGADPLRLKREIDLADCLIAPSEFVVDSLVCIGTPREKICVVPFGVDLDRFRPASTSDSVRPFTVLYVGQIALRKGVHHLLEAWRQVALKDAQLILVGGLAEPAAGEVLARYAGLYQWIPGVPNHELSRYYQQSDVFVLPSLAEGSALVSYEALACGLPSIVTNHSGTVIRDQVDGLVIPAGDVAALSRSILELKNGNDRRRTFGAAARQRAAEFSWSRYRSNLRSVLEHAYEVSASRFAERAAITSEQRLA